MRHTFHAVAKDVRRGLREGWLGIPLVMGLFPIVFCAVHALMWGAN